MAGLGTVHMRTEATPLVRAEHIVVEYRAGNRHSKFQAVSDVSIDLLKGETVGIVGESGCGKSTLARSILQLPRPTSGSVFFDSVDLTTVSANEVRQARQKLQIVLQDPISSINPRRKILDVVAEPLVIWGVPRSERAARVEEALHAVGLDPAHVGGRLRHELSGGQCQRVCIARALVAAPDVLVCDEAVSALDVSVRAQILNIIQDLKQRYGLSILFISHDLSVIRYMSDRVVVMYLGRLCEVGGSDSVYHRPLHPYTQALIGATPVPDPRVAAEPPELAGDLPSPLYPPSGCRFRTRCPRSTDICSSEEPMMRELQEGHFVACHHPLDDGDAVTVGERRSA